MTARTYTCATCGARAPGGEPLHDMRVCPHCGAAFCLRCRPDHDAVCTGPSVQSAQSADSGFDSEGFTAEKRFEAIRQKYLDETGRARASRFDEEKIRAWADSLHVPLLAIYRGIERALDTARGRGDAVFAFGYVEPHIATAAGRYRETRAGQGPTARLQ